MTPEPEAVQSSSPARDRSVRGACFFNPSSGWGRKHSVADVEKAVRAASLDFIRLEPSVDIFREVRMRIDRGERLFIAAGGDGTVNHVIQPLVNTDARLGVLPLGTYNHFARDLAIPLDWNEALSVILDGSTRHVDAARANDRFFINNISLGLYPHAVEHREKFRGQSRFKAYRHALLGTLRNPKPTSLVIDTEHHLQAIRTHLFMVSVNPYDLTQIGFEAPRPSLERGELAVVWFPEMRLLRFVLVVARYLRGKVSAEDGLHTLRTRQLKVSSRRAMHLGMDGELFVMESPLVITIVPQGLQVRVPRK
jgi:YegS/Rv2252/BmrU family lipid kinase